MNAYKQFFLTTSEEVSFLKDAIIGKFCKNECSGRGAILKDGIFYSCTCVIEFEKKLRLIQANIPRKYWEFDLRNLTKEYSESNKLPLNIIKAYTTKIKEMAEKGIGLYIQGAHGLAKSALSFYIAKEAIKNDVVCYSTNMSQLSKLFHEIKLEESSKRIEWIKKDVELLIVEEIEKDFNVSDSTTFTGSFVNDFFRSLYDNKKALIITSNMTKQTLKQANIHAGNVTDRFEELVDIILTGHSFRKQDTNLKQILGDK